MRRRTASSSPGDAPPSSAAGGADFAVGVLTDDDALVRAVALVVRRSGGSVTVARDARAMCEIFGSDRHAAYVVDQLTYERLVQPKAPCAEDPRRGGIELFVAPSARSTRERRAAGSLLFQRGDLDSLTSHLAAAIPCRQRPDAVHTILGESAEIRAVREQIRSVARFHDVPVLVLGETGTGKELVAESLHRATFGERRPFVAVNCAAVPASLFEAELFGHEEGAYTGARGSRSGLLDAAAGGTIFLDEIGEMPPELQPKLLRVLSNRVFRRIGSNRDRPMLARVVSATNRGIDASGGIPGLRDDLYFRLAGFSIVLPPLRERPADVPILARHFLEDFCKRHGMTGTSLGDEAQTWLSGQPFPGNVRELRSVIGQLVILAGGGAIGPQAIQALLASRSHGKRPTSIAPPPEAVIGAARPVPDPGAPTPSLRVFERQMIERALEECGGNLTRAAQALGIPRTTLAAKVRRIRQERGQ